jgi:hypothetical protein
VRRASSSPASAASPSWDLSENRMNSFPEPDERALASIRAPLGIEVHLAPEDPRRADLDRKAIAKLRRVMPRCHVKYVSATSIGLFEQSAPHYGEIWYELGGKREMSRATTAESALETIYDLAGVKPPVETDDESSAASARGRRPRARRRCSTASGRRDRRRRASHRRTQI